MKLHLRVPKSFISFATLFLLLFGSPCPGEPAEMRKLKFYNTHTQQRLEVYYREGENYLPQAFKEISYILRDHRNGEIHPIDPKLLDFLYDLLTEVSFDGEVHIISGYRSPESNIKLRKQSNGVADRSLHLKGKALDFRLPGIDTKRLRDTALSMKRGGVGYYKRLNFIHIDTGRVRFW
jgi:uncharacterized protein YcbK (DUF882 family)